MGREVLSSVAWNPGYAAVNWFAAWRHDTRCPIVEDEVPRSEGNAAHPDRAGPAPPAPEIGALRSPSAVTEQASSAAFNEDRLDLLENAQRSARDRRQTDLRFIGRTLILVILLIAILVGALAFWSRSAGNDPPSPPSRTPFKSQVLAR